MNTVDERAGMLATAEDVAAARSLPRDVLARAIARYEEARELAARAAELAGMDRRLGPWAELEAADLADAGAHLVRVVAAAGLDLARLLDLVDVPVGPELAAHPDDRPAWVDDAMRAAEGMGEAACMARLFGPRSHREPIAGWLDVVLVRVKELGRGEATRRLLGAPGQGAG